MGVRISTAISIALINSKRSAATSLRESGRFTPNAVDAGVSGAKESRPPLDRLLQMRSGAGSMCYSRGGWIASGGTCDVL